ncbi:MAG: hypothetical protein ACXVXH_08035 [Nocardioidaceae bacterium]
MRPTLAAGTLLLLAGVAGCGGQSSPGGQVPALQQSLVQVDDAMHGHQWRTVRSDIDVLLARTRQALRANEITSAQAARIRDAARGLKSRLP